jgi:hypothetical protein
MAALAPAELPSDPAREGTCAAWVAEMVLSGQVAKTADLIGATHLNGWVVTRDMAAHVQPYVDLMRSYGGVVHVERKVVLNSLIEGTPDAFAVMDAEGVLRVKDLKYGFLIVEPFENEQVSIYTGAILRMLTARGVVIRKVVLSIYQPRAWHPAGIDREWSVDPEVLMTYVHKIEAAGVRTQQPNPPATPGEHCHYCPAMATCPAAAHETYRIHDYLVVAQQRHMTATEMAEELKFLETVEAMVTGRLKAVTAEAEARIGHGEHIPGWHMETRSGQRRFRVPPEIVKFFTGIDPTVEKCVTPAELERMGALPSVVQKLSETPRLEPKLKRVSANYYTNLFKRKPK